MSAIEIPAVVMGGVLALLVAALAIALWRAQCDPKRPDLLDLITSTDRTGKVRFDSRKCFEAGAFGTTTWAFVFLTLSHQLTEWFFAGYAAAWVFARSMRDREQRLNSAGGRDPDREQARSHDPPL